MSKDNLMVKKHTATIHIKGDLSLIQRKMMNALLLQAYENLPNQNTHTINYNLLCEYMNFDSNDVEHITNSLEGLMKTVITWDYFGNNGRKVWEGSSLLASYKIKQGVIYYEYSSMLIDKIYSPEIYSRINISTVNKLNSKYSAIIYENCFRYIDSGSTGWIDIEIFKGAMGIDELASYANRFYLFKSKVLKSSIKEINDSTDIIISPEYKTQGRKTTAIKFKVQRKPEIIHEVIVNNRSVDSNILNELLSLNISKQTAQGLIENHGEEYIKEKILFVEKMQKEGKVKSSIGGLFISAVENNFKDPKFEADKEAKKLAEKIKKIKKIEDLLQSLESDKRKIERIHRGEVRETINNRYNEMPEFSQKAIWYSFAQNLSEMMLEGFKRDNWNCGMNYSAIKKFWVDTQKISLPDINEIAKKEGIKSFYDLEEKISKAKKDIEILNGELKPSN